MRQLHVSQKMVYLFLGWKMLHNYFWGSRMDFHPIALLLCAIVPLAHVYNFFRESRMVYNPIVHLFWRITVRHTHVYNFFWVFWIALSFTWNRAHDTRIQLFLSILDGFLQSIHKRVRFFNPPTDVPTFVCRSSFSYVCMLLYRTETDVPTMTPFFFLSIFKFKHFL